MRAYSITLNAIILLAIATQSLPTLADNKHHHKHHVNKHRHGHTVKVLPRGHARLRVKNVNYYFHRGVFYRNKGTGFIVVRAPIGARIKILPSGYVRFVIGHRHYYYVNSSYYFYAPETKEYVVVEEPTGAAEALKKNNAKATTIYTYPDKGQSDAQMKTDRYECHEWSIKEANYDPVGQTQQQSTPNDYTRAFTACMSSRGYTVR